MDLIENLLGWTLGGSPRFDLPLQGAELHVGERPGTSRSSKKSFCLEPGIEFQQVTKLGPPFLGSSSRVRQVLGVNDFTWAGDQHAGVSEWLASYPQCCTENPFAKQLAKLANLGILDHDGSPLG